MEFYRVWRILAGNKWVLIWLPVVATCVGLAVTYVLPEQFESTALVLVRPFEDIKFGSRDEDKKALPDFPVNLSAPVDAPSKTYMEVIKSPAVAAKIVETLQLDVPPPATFQSALDAFKDELRTWIKTTIRTARNYSKYGRDIPASAFDLAVEDVENNLTVAVRKDTYAFAITYRASKPEQAAAVANKAAEIFLGQSSDAYRSEAARAREFIEVQLVDSRKALDQARAAVLAFKKAGGTFALNAEYDQQLKNVSDLENTLAKAEGKLAGLKKRDYFSKDTPNVAAQQAEILELKDQVSSLHTSLAAYPAKETQMNATALTESLAEKSYEFFLKQYQEARVKEFATVTEIRIVSPAVAALYPIKPVKILYAGMSFGLAVVVAIAWAVFFEALDPRVRTIRVLDDELGVPVLGAIPRLRRSWWTVGT